MGGGQLIVRTQTDVFTGKMVLHCHILEHEDEGMMAYIGIDGEEGATWSGAAAIDATCTRSAETTVTTTTATTTVPVDQTVTFTMVVLPRLKNNVNPTSNKFRNLLKSAITAGLQDVGTTSITSIEVPSGFVVGRYRTYTTLTVGVSVVVRSVFHTAMLNTLNDAMVSDFAFEVEKVLVQNRMVRDIDSIVVEDVVTNGRRLQDIAIDVLAPRRLMPKRGRTPSGRPAGSNCLRDDGRAPQGAASSSSTQIYQLSVRNIPIDTAMSDELHVYLEEAMASSMGDGCDISAVASITVEYLAGEYVKMPDVTITGSGGMTEEQCSYLLNLQLNKTSMVPSLENNNLFQNGGLIVKDDNSATNDGTDNAGRKCCKSCTKCPPKRLQKPAEGFNEAEFVAKREYQGVDRNLCRSGTFLSEADDTIAGVSVMADVKCRDMTGCIAYERRPQEGKISYYSSIATSAAETAGTPRQKCMVKSIALCGSSCDAGISSAYSRLESETCTCPDTAPAVWSCANGLTLKNFGSYLDKRNSLAIEADRCCNDSSVPTQICTNNVDKICRTVASEAVICRPVFAFLIVVGSFVAWTQI